MISLIHLPEVIFTLIQPFLSYDELSLFPQHLQARVWRLEKENDYSPTDAEDEFQSLEHARQGVPIIGIE